MSQGEGGERRVGRAEPWKRRGPSRVQTLNALEFVLAGEQAPQRKGATFVILRAEKARPCHGLPRARGANGLGQDERVGPRWIAVVAKVDDGCRAVGQLRDCFPELPQD